jgi:hypothetical protein
MDGILEDILEDVEDAASDVWEGIIGDRPSASTPPIVAQPTPIPQPVPQQPQMMIAGMNPMMIAALAGGAVLLFLLLKKK